MTKAISKPHPNEQLLQAAPLSEAAGSLRSPAAFFIIRAAAELRALGAPTVIVIISENDVVIATTVWLARRGIRPIRVCLVTPVTGTRYEDKQRLQAALAAEGIDPSNLHAVTTGPDIIAKSAEEYWQVECKGVGSGVQSTQRNNFDRALASTVSYFGSAVEIGVECENRQPVLGLALPKSRDYIAQLRRRVRPSLRRTINLWLLLYEPSTGKVESVAPDQSVPGP